MKSADGIRTPFVSAYRYTIPVWIAALFLMATPVWGQSSVATTTVPRAHDASATAFVGVHLVPMDSERIVARQTVLVRAGRIAAIGPVAETPVPEGAQVIDGTGRYLMPGLADMHVHMFDPDEMILYLANGITTVRNLHGTPTHLRWRDSLSTEAMLGPRLFTSGPIIDGDPPTRGTNKVIRTPAEAAQIVRAQKQAGYDYIKIYDNVPRDLYEVLLATARQQDIPVVGHLPTPVGLTGLLEAKHQKAIEHVEELLPFFDDGRDTTNATATARALARQGVWLGPTIAVLMWPFRQAEPAIYELPERRYMRPETMEAWRWATSPTTLPPGASRVRERRWQFALLFTKHFHEAGGQLLAGSDAPIPTMIPGFSLIHELRAFVEAGLSPYEALATATRNPARFVGQPEAFGTLTAGASADLVLLKANPLEDVNHTQQRIGVMVRGRWLPEAFLQQRLEDIARQYHTE